MRALVAVLLALAVKGRSEPGYAGAQACAKCHATIHREWAQSLHARMLQPASERTIEGDFAQGGSSVKHRIDYTLGGRRIQEYLSKLPDGRIIILPLAWDNVRKKWIPESEVDNPEEAPGEKAQVWNKSCFSCHVSGGNKNFDLRQLRYNTTWQDLGVNCERCHGPSARHVAEAGKAAILNPARLDAVRSTMVCAQCHSFRDVYVDRFKAGANYYDYFLPVMQYRLPPSDDPPYWGDGRPRWLSNEAFALWQSQCFLKGNATCLTCHSQPHRTASVQANNALCTRCHSNIAANVTAHTHHAANSAGSSCVECHMPAAVAGLRTRMRDHSLSIPVPENTIRYGIPNACNLCHKDQDSEWTRRQMKAWYSGGPRQKFIGRAEAFTLAQNGNPAAVPALLRVLADPSGGPVIRANAAGFLGNFPNDPAAYDAVLRAFSDREPLVRATAVLALRPRAAQREAAAPATIYLLKDEVATVRINAAIALVAMGVRQVPGDDGERFERAKALYRARAALDADDAGQQFAAGKFSFLSGDMDAAVTAFRAALTLDPNIPAQYYLAAAEVQKGEFAPAREVLKAIPRNDVQYAAAQRLLAEIDLKSSGKAADAEAIFAGAQAQFRNGNYGPALQGFEQALRMAPQADWLIQAQIARAICLQKLSQIADAEAAMQALAGNASARNNVDLQLAYIELLYDTGRPEEALKRADDLVVAAPDAPMAHLWRAKVLLQLHRAGEAATAAEQSMRLQPDLPAAHNLLIRIYQVEGRTKEAAEQAQWLRDYQRRIESR